MRHNLCFEDFHWRNNATEEIEEIETFICDFPFDILTNQVRSPILDPHIGDLSPFMCGRAFNQKIQWKVQLKTRPVESECIQCAIGKKTFNKENTLNKQVETHTGECP
ncbi:hypothetical protein CEXT_67371 [Caerostris extrusa]|uniref:C2H2-type domain-containing protein n=1 Tax=Caerostris extrusa TaxID=172846 RepID=A0AAV4NT28_CAEEX|nr:hypothetical protein CEXT_67371 [Caerostris extrusa]